VKEGEINNKESIECINGREEGREEMERRQNGYMEGQEALNPLL
jgi:hypothetical protein